eukprot:351853-Chlamydomonas_euryale.AAC.4
MPPGTAGEHAPRACSATQPPHQTRPVKRDGGCSGEPRHATPDQDARHRAHVPQPAPSLGPTAAACERAPSCYLKIHLCDAPFVCVLHATV